MNNMSSVFTIVGDPHVTPKSLDKAAKLFDKIEELGQPTIILGDLFDTKEILRGSCLNLVFNKLKQSKLHFTILVGNHDLFRLDQAEHALEVLKELPNVTIIDSIQKHKTLPFIFFPYIHDKACLKEKLTEIADKNLIAFGHFEVSGFDFGNGHICEDSQITYKDFSGFKRVISGHFHKFQQTGIFTYLGTPFSHSFGEANQTKVLGMYNAELDTLELLSTDFPKHVSLKLDTSKDTFSKELSDFVTTYSKDLIRIQLYGSPEDIAKLDKTKFQGFNIKWEDKSENIVNNAITLDESLDNKTQFQQWAKNIKKLDQATTLLGLNILEGLNVK